MTNQEYSSPVITLKEEDTIHDAIIKMHQNNIKRIVITSDDTRKDTPIGIVTESDIVKFLDEDKTERALDKIHVEEIVSKNLVTINAGQGDHLTQCAFRMRTFQISSIVVIDDEGKLVGITTESDLTKSFSEKHAGNYKVNDYMTKKVFTCRESDSLEYALRMLNKNKISRLVVTDNKGNPIGIITYNTFLRHSECFKLGTKSGNYLIPNESSADLFVRDLMNNEVLTVDQESDLAASSKLMINHNVSGIPVIASSSGELVGIISKSDIVTAFSQVLIHKKMREIDPHFR